jgi:hypothetical protein
MGDIGFGYGGEWHLLRYLGRHRKVLDKAIQAEMPDVKAIEWFDFRFAPKAKHFDGELKGVEFLHEDEPAKVHWPEFWPRRGNIPNWDAVALLTTNRNELCWLLVEAKANVGELKAPCRAKNEGGLKKIEEALRLTKIAVGVDPERDWTSNYYQYANRLAVLFHFNHHKPPPARLLHIYFLADSNPKANCPATWQGWGPHLEKCEQCLGLTHRSDLEKSVFSLFLPVCGQNGEFGGARG